MRGRKKQKDAKRKTISVKVTEKYFETYSKSPDVRAEIRKQVNEYLKIFRI